MVFERPKRPSKPGSATRRPDAKGQKGKPKKVITSSGHHGGSGGNRGRGGGNGGNNGENGDVPSPWLQHPLDPNPNPAAEASFVEYLRWMRSLPTDPAEKKRRTTQDANTKIQLLQMAEVGADYRKRLEVLTNRTKRIAGAERCFQAQCSWRIRVGGHRGPENILLPAFDSLGMPYIPASTLRGVARAQAIRHFMAEGDSWQDAEKKVAPYFGSLEEKTVAHTGKVIFLDAYPLPSKSGESGGLAVDMANNIWSWDIDDQMKYAPNPNPFFSLRESTFLIGLQPGRQCSVEVFDQVKAWLIAGLQFGIGSQVNTGYGELLVAGQGRRSDEFFSIDFNLEGQLIHGRQQFDRWNFNDQKGEWQARTAADAEVRSVALKSMLRYWFRAFARGVLQPRKVKELEANLFGAINPQSWGWVVFHLRDGRVLQPEARLNAQGQRDPCGEQSGTLTLFYSSEAPVNQHETIKVLFRNLTWMMFHLGGVGQGARRPCYSRQTRERAPWWRGSILIPNSSDSLWKLPKDVRAFQQRFQQRLQDFYTALQTLTDQSLNPHDPLTIGTVRRDRWIEAVDAHCRIIVCAGEAKFEKPYALAVLHDPDFKKGQEYDGNLCGQVRGGVKPSPVWIADIDEYQVVTVFGATQDPRCRYLKELQRRASRHGYAQIFPFSN